MFVRHAEVDMETILVMFSGGLDSTYMLYHYLPGKVVTLALGHNYDDFDSPQVQDRVRRQLLPKLWWALRDRLHHGDKLNPEIAKPLFDLRVTRDRMCRDLPDDLMKLCWSCRRPDFVEGQGLPCGRCETCQTVEKKEKG